MKRCFYLKRQKRVNTFFYFFPIFDFLPVFDSPAALGAKAGEAHLLAEPARGCQYFFWDFLENSFVRALALGYGPTMGHEPLE